MNRLTGLLLAMAIGGLGGYIIADDQRIEQANADDKISLTIVSKCWTAQR